MVQEGLREVCPLVGPVCRYGQFDLGRARVADRSDEGGEGRDLESATAKARTYVSEHRRDARGRPDSFETGICEPFSMQCKSRYGGQWITVASCPLKPRRRGGESYADGHWASATVERSHSSPSPPASAVLDCSAVAMTTTPQHAKLCRCE